MSKAYPPGMYDDKLKEVFKLLEESAEESEQEQENAEETTENLLKELEGLNNNPLQGEEAAMAEFSIMMKQWEALVEDYERQEAEEEKLKESESETE